MYIDDNFVKEYDGLITKKIARSGISGELFDHIKVKIYERIMASDSFDPKKGKMSTWLWSICRSVISNEVKKHGRSQGVMDHQPLQLEDANNVIGQEDAGTAADELNRLIKKADLSERDEAILRDSHLRAITSQEIAANYGMERRAVEQVLYRAMKALRQAVDDDA